MDEKQVLKLIQEGISQSASKNRFSVSNIPYHGHNGVDSARIPFENLVNSDNYVAISRVYLSTAQILSLHSSPLTIIPVQTTGSTTASTSIGSVIIVEGITAKLIYNGTAYVGANNLEFRYTDASGAKVTADIPNTFINTAGSAYAHVAGIVTEFTPVQNTPIIVTVPTANPTTGNSTIQLIIKWRTVSI